MSNQNCLMLLLNPPLNSNLNSSFTIGAQEGISLKCFSPLISIPQIGFIGCNGADFFHGQSTTNLYSISIPFRHGYKGLHICLLIYASLVGSGALSRMLLCFTYQCIKDVILFQTGFFGCVFIHNVQTFGISRASIQAHFPKCYDYTVFKISV